MDDNSEFCGERKTETSGYTRSEWFIDILLLLISISFFLSINDIDFINKIVKWFNGN